MSNHGKHFDIDSVSDAMPSVALQSLAVASEPDIMDSEYPCMAHGSRWWDVDSDDGNDEFYFHQALCSPDVMLHHAGHCDVESVAEVSVALQPVALIVSCKAKARSQTHWNPTDKEMIEMSNAFNNMVCNWSFVKARAPKACVRYVNKCLQLSVIRLCAREARCHARRFSNACCCNDSLSGYGSVESMANFDAVVAYLNARTAFVWVFTTQRRAAPHIAWGLGNIALVFWIGVHRSDMSVWQMCLACIKQGVGWQLG